MSMSFKAWRENVVGRYIDIDGWYGAQCWDLWADFGHRVGGAPIRLTWTSANAGADSGLVSSIWTKFPAVPGLEDYFYQVDKTATILQGDTLIWGRSTAYPDSHIAQATGRVNGNLVEVVSQNTRGSAGSAAGATEVVWLTKSGLLGILRAKNLTPTPQDGQEEDEEMANNGVVYRGEGLPAGQARCAIMNTQSGYFQEYVTKGSNATMAEVFRTGSFLETDKSMFESMKDACAAVRAGKGK